MVHEGGNLSDITNTAHTQSGLIIYRLSQTVQ